MGSFRDLLVTTVTWLGRATFLPREVVNFTLFIEQIEPQTRYLERIEAQTRLIERQLDWTVER